MTKQPSNGVKMIANPVATYRSELMAIASFAILLTHFKCSLGSLPLDRLALCSQGGVDAFFFLSGFGLYYSGQKSASVLSFYKKRAIRLLPPFLLIFAITMAIRQNFSIERLFWGGSSLAYWIPFARKYTFGWFVSVIIALYAIFPYYNRWFKQCPRLSTLSGQIMGFILTTAYAYHFLVLHPGGYNQYVLATARLPIFFMGIYYAYKINQPYANNKSFIKRQRVEIIAAIIAFMLYNCAIDHYGFMLMRNSGMLYLPFLLIVPGTCIALCYAFKFMSTWHITRLLLRLLKLLGSCTLESYLLIGITYNYVFSLAKALCITPLASNTIIAIATLLLAFVAHTLIQKITQFIIQ